MPISPERANLQVKVQCLLASVMEALSLEPENQVSGQIVLYPWTLFAQSPSLEETAFPAL